MAWEILLGAALEAGLSLLAEAGFGEQIRDLRARLSKREEKKRRAAFEQAFAQAREAVGEEAIRPLLEHAPFQEAVVTGLLDPQHGFDLESAAEVWGEQLPAQARSLRRFFFTLENALLADDTWGPLLQRYQELRFQREVLAALKERRLDAPVRRITALLEAELARRREVTASGSRSVAVGGDVRDSSVHTGDVVQVVVQRLIVQSGALPVAGMEPQALRRRYLQEVAIDANRLPWFAMDPEYADPQRGGGMGLADVYTALDTTELERVEREEELRALMVRLQEGEARRIPAQEQVDRQNRLLILGDPGSGKSTLIKHLAYILAQAGLAEDAAPWLDRLQPWTQGTLLPVLVELRGWAAALSAAALAPNRRGGAGLLLDYLEQMLGSWKLGEFWPLLNAAIGGNGEKLLILLDGLDEVPTGLRGVVVEAVQDFADRYRQHRYVVTCRPYAYVGQPWQLQGFHQVTLAPFDREQVDHFVRAWYGQLGQRGSFSEREAEERAGKLAVVVRRPDLQGLAGRPLLLTVMALLHTFQGQLPEDRTELYANAVDLFLRRWEGRVGEEAGLLEHLDVPGLRMSDLEAGLYEVAFRTHSAVGAEEGPADIPEGDLRQWLAPYLAGSWDRAGDFVDYIRERAGLLVRHKTAAYTFPHRTFQEFLAACHLVGRPDYPGEAVGLARADPDRWREVFVLAAGHAARTHRLSQAIAAVNALCPQEVGGAACDGGAYRCAVLAGEALREIGLVGVGREAAGQAVLERVRGWLVAAIAADEVLEPRQRAEAGVVLAHIGDPRFRADAWYLSDEPLLGFVEVPAGPFLMGSSDADGLAYENEKTQHEVELPRYYIGRYPVTNAQYGMFVEAGGYEEGRYWEEARSVEVWKQGRVRGWFDGEPRSEPVDFGEPFNLPNHPVVGVSWYEALAYGRWLTEVLREWGGVTEPLAALLREGGWEVRLPSEAEWEKAVRGEGGRIYPWGEGADPNKANYDQTGIGTTSAVGCFPGGASPYGVQDMVGNVWEWTGSLYRGYPYNAGGGREDLEAGLDEVRVLRGGAFDDDHRGVRCASRLRNLPVSRLRGRGFRVVVAAPFSRRSGAAPSGL